MSISKAVKQKAIELGFDLVGITDSAAIAKKDISILKNHLANGNTGDMEYLHRNFEKRVNPKNLMPGAKSVICVALNYKPVPNSFKAPFGCQIADFAKYEDYHSFIKVGLFKLAEFIAENFKSDLEYKACVDSVPLAERSLAARAGLGFIGKNKMLINPKLGSRLLLGELITNIKLDCDKPVKNLCAGCDRCIRSCPGKVFEDGNFDSRKCVSYLTIENKGEIKDADKEKIDNRLFGCDKCVSSCPFDQNAPVRSNTNFTFINPLADITLQDILYWDKRDFDNHLKGTAMHRLGLQNLKRNVSICLDNITKSQGQGTRKTSDSPLGCSQPE